MIDATQSTTQTAASPASITMPSIGETGGFDAALEAERRAQAAAQARQSEIDSIREKGFTNWVRDTRIEKLKEELRKQVMAEMGVTEDSMVGLSAKVRQILEQRIQAEVEKRLAQAETGTGGSTDDGGEATTGSAGSTANGSTASGNGTSGGRTLLAAQEQAQARSPDPVTNPRDKDPTGKSCPVIPALTMPGPAIVF